MGTYVVKGRIPYLMIEMLFPVHFWSSCNRKKRRLAINNGKSFMSYNILTFKHKSCHETTFVATGSFGGCHNDNLRCQQWHDKVGIKTTPGFQCMFKCFMYIPCKVHIPNFTVISGYTIWPSSCAKYCKDGVHSLHDGFHVQLILWLQLRCFPYWVVSALYVLNWCLTTRKYICILYHFTEKWQIISLKHSF